MKPADIRSRIQHGLSRGAGGGIATGLALAGLLISLGGCPRHPANRPADRAQLVQQGYLKASNTDASDGFGYSVALAGDTLAVGASSEDSNATGVNGNADDNSAAESGTVYVFTLP